MLTEPLMTNFGMIPVAVELRRVARGHAAHRHGGHRLDKTHISCAGPGGYTRLNGLEPDMFVAGKAMTSGGIPAAWWRRQPGDRRRLWKIVPRVNPRLLSRHISGLAARSPAACA